jgi:hypothetical protein
MDLAHSSNSLFWLLYEGSIIGGKSGRKSVRRFLWSSTGGRVADEPGVLGKRWSNGRYILKTELTGFVGVGCRV